MIDYEEHDEYFEYLETLSESDLNKELKWLESIGKAKANNQNFVVIDHFYDM
jgi:hypothetical protein